MLRTLVLLAGLLMLVPPGARAEETITTDTADYCGALAARMAQHGDMPPDARALLSEGQAMCARGHVVGGLRRVRLALVLMRERLPP